MYRICSECDDFPYIIVIALFTFVTLYSAALGMELRRTTAMPIDVVPCGLRAPPLRDGVEPETSQRRCLNNEKIRVVTE